MKKNITFALILIIILLGISNKGLTRALIFFGEGIIHITSMEADTSGPMYEVIFGKDKDGKEKVIWIKNKFFLPDIIHTIELEKGIARDEAIETAKEENIKEALNIQLSYVPPFIGKNLGGLKEGVYWYIKDKYDNYLFIDFVTGNKIKKGGPYNEYYYAQ